MASSDARGADVPAEEAFRSGFVAIVGRPNVGKSTLLNGLVGEKVAIVSRRPQTTRRRILGIVTTEAAQAVLVDTPGIHKPRTTLGRHMVSAARHSLPDADVVLFVVDVSVAPTDEDRAVAGMVRAAAGPVVLALNKSDLLAPADVVAHTAAYSELAAAERWMLVAAIDGHNLDLLWGMVVTLLPPGPLFYPPEQLSDQTDRVLAAELVREAALRQLRQEVPHGIDVVVTDWQVQPNGVVHIGALVIVERESHKGIVIGAGGRTIKAVGASARRAIERMLTGRVYLELQVKVRTGWRDSAAELKRLGYS